MRRKGIPGTRRSEQALKIEKRKSKIENRGQAYVKMRKSSIANAVNQELSSAQELSWGSYRWLQSFCTRPSPSTSIHTLLKKRLPSLFFAYSRACHGKLSVTEVFLYRDSSKSEVCDTMAPQRMLTCKLEDIIIHGSSRARIHAHLQG